ncbi:MAG: hypothetical protein ACRDXC_13840 [Acidimicrobiales bacterium]
MDVAGTAREMHGGAPPGSAAAGLGHRPPIPLVCVSSMALVLVSGIYLAAYLPRHAPLGPAIGLVAAAGVVLLAAVVLVARLRDFAWDPFFLVVKWAALAYLVIAGILEYVFVYDGTRGSMLVLLTMSLFVFAVDIPVLLGFSVARFQGPDAGA